MAYFALGWTSLLLALDSPIHEIGEQLFWVHMTQHEILMLVSAPLLVLSRPLVPFLYAFSPSARQRVAAISHTRAFSTIWRSISAPVSAWLISALALWLGMLPGFSQEPSKMTGLTRRSTQHFSSPRSCFGGPWRMAHL